MSRSNSSAVPLFNQIVHAIVGELREKGVGTIQANCEGFHKPGKVHWDDADDGIVPDIVAQHDGATHVFEIETRDHLTPENVEDRWRLLSVFAKRSHGDFYLIIPERREEDFQRVIRQVSVQAKILKLTGIA